MQTSMLFRPRLITRDHALSRIYVPLHHRPRVTLCSLAVTATNPPYEVRLRHGPFRLRLSS